MKFWLSVARALIGLALLSVAFAPASIADTKAKDSDVIEKIRAKAKRIEEFKALLNNPDANIRIGTIDALVNGDDPVLRDIAVETGFASNDVIVKAAALRALFFSLDTIPLTVRPEVAAAGSEGKETVHSLRFRSIDRSKGSFVILSGNWGGTGQVSGSTISLTVAGCTFVLQPKADFTITGPSVCSGLKGTATAKLR